MNAEDHHHITDGMTGIDDIDKSEIEYASEVAALVERARSYLSSQSWCERIVEGWVEYSCGYVIGIFYFHIIPAREDVPRYVWVIAGDLPTAYMDGEFHSSAWEALSAYIVEMQEWVDRVLDGRSITDDVITVNVPPEPKWADELAKRLGFVRENFLPCQRGAPSSR